MDLELTGRVGGPVAPPRTAVGGRGEYELLTAAANAATMTLLGSETTGPAYLHWQAPRPR